jgi:hypothetical protein
MELSPPFAYKWAFLFWVAEMGHHLRFCVWASFAAAGLGGGLLLDGLH